MEYCMIVITTSVCLQYVILQAPYQVERQKYSEELERLQQLPEWKRNLIVKKRGNTD